MPYLIAAIIITLFLYIRFGQKGLGLAFFLIAALAAMRGLTIIAVPLIILSIYLITRPANLNRKQQPPNDKSSSNPAVTSRFLHMQLSQNTGKLSGKIRSGKFAGQTCEELNLKQLLELLITCQQEDSESEQLLMAYLDQAHPYWQDKISEFKRSQTTGASNQMSEQEACEILGLSATPTEEEIKTAHRRLMKKFHPDQGGSAHLAAVINQAKDILLNK